MKSLRRIDIIAVGCLLTAGLCPAAGPPSWPSGFPPGPAPAVAPAAPAPPPPDTSLKHLPGNSLEFTRAQIADGFGPADWYPGDHPQMPEIVAHGKKPG